MKKQKKLYKQTFTQNMLSKSKPEIKEYHKEDYTCITFEPDLQKFNMEKLDEDIIALSDVVLSDGKVAPRQRILNKLKEQFQERFDI